jgi:hypothetical protein
LSWPSWLLLPMPVAPLYLVTIYITGTQYDGIHILYSRLWRKKKEKVTCNFFFLMLYRDKLIVCLSPLHFFFYCWGKCKLYIWISGFWSIWDYFYRPVSDLVWHNSRVSHRLFAASRRLLDSSWKGAQWFAK